MKQLRSETESEPAGNVKYSSWSERSGEKPAWLIDEESTKLAQSPPVSAQNMDPSAAQEFYHQQKQVSLVRNSSGMGAEALIPAEASGFTAAGCLPFGIFALYNGQLALGILGVVGQFFPPLNLAYIGIVGFHGKRLAWQNRKFESVEHFRSVMEAWDAWGLGWFALNFIVGFIIGLSIGLSDYM